MKPVPMMLLAAVLSLCAMGAAPTPDPRNMKAYPAADQGMTRFLLQVPADQDEGSLKVELIVGKSAMVDGVNHYFFGGKIEEQTIEGWGFPRYDVKQVGPMAGTLMGVDPRAPKVERFITLGGDPYLIRYNSRLPVVVYVPEGFEVKYRIWKADPQPTAMPKG